MGLLEVIKENKNLRRIFGKRELVIIEKQLMGVALTASERTRLSRDIRKKFEAISALIPSAQEFRLKHGSVVRQRIDEAKDAVLKGTYLPRIKRIILFGSAVTRQLTLASDIDLAVEFISITKREVLQFRLDILRKVNNSIDIKVYNVLPEKIKKEIDVNGRVIYERKNKR